MIESIRAFLTLIAALASMQTYAAAHGLDDVQYHTTIRGPRGPCHIVVWTNGEPAPMPIRDYVWVYSNADDDPACWDIGHLVRRDVAVNNAE